MTRLTFALPTMTPVEIEQSKLKNYVSGLESQAKLIARLTVSLCMAVQFVILKYLIPQYLNIYQDFDMKLPPSVNLIYVSLLGGIVCLLLTSIIPMLNERMTTGLLRDTNDKITIKSNLLNPIFSAIIPLYVLMSTMILLSAVVLPLYSLTSTF